MSCISTGAVSMLSASSYRGIVVGQICCHITFSSSPAIRCALVVLIAVAVLCFFSSRSRHTRLQGDWSSDVCSSDYHGLHLAYCTNVHRGETWPETFAALQKYTLAVRDRVCPDKPYAIGLRLSHQAAVELSDRPTLLQFQKWLSQNRSYVFTINGFPYGQFHGTRVKQQVYQPDWTSERRLEYTNLLFDILAQLVPGNIEGG